MVLFLNIYQLQFIRKMGIHNLIQLSVQKEGKSPMTKRIIKLIKIAKKENIKAIFTSKETSPKSSEVLAKELKIPVKQFSPLDMDWSKNLIDVARAIVDK